MQSEESTPPGAETNSRREDQNSWILNILSIVILQLCEPKTRRIQTFIITAHHPDRHLVFVRAADQLLGRLKRPLSASCLLVTAHGFIENE